MASDSVANMDSDGSLTDLSDQEFEKPCDPYFPFVGLDFDSGGEDDLFDEDASIVPAPAKTVKSSGSGNSKKRRRSGGGNDSEESDEDYAPGKEAKRRKSITQKKRAMKAKEKKEIEQMQRPFTLQQTRKLHIKEWKNAVKRDEELRQQREGDWQKNRAEQEKASSWKEGRKVHLFDLPPELLDMIFSFDKGYSVQDYINLSGTCYFLRLPLQNDELWRAIYMQLGPPAQGKPIQDQHPAYELGTTICIGSRRRFPTAATLPSYQEEHKPANYIYRQFHVEPMQARPEPVSLAERCQEVLEQLNQKKKEEESFQVTRWSAGYVYTTKAALEGMTEEARKKVFAVVALEMQHLPLCQEEVHKGGQNKVVHGLLRPRCLPLTPWQVLTIRSVNFKMISAKDCMVKQWLHIDEVNLFHSDPITLPLTSKTPDVPYHCVKEFISRNQPILQDRKYRRHRVLLQRDARVPHWKEENVEHAIPVCTRCGRYHDQDLKGCIYWWDAPDDPDYKPTYMGEPHDEAVVDDDDGDDSNEGEGRGAGEAEEEQQDQEEEEEDVKPVIDLGNVEESDHSMED